MPVRVSLQAPTMMFSSTVMRSKIFGVWNVRTIPARLRSCTDCVVSGWPRNSIVPVCRGR